MPQNSHINQQYGNHQHSTVQPIRFGKTLFIRYTHADQRKHRQQHDSDKQQVIPNRCDRFIPERGHRSSTHLHLTCGIECSKNQIVNDLASVKDNQHQCYQQHQEKLPAASHKRQHKRKDACNDSTETNNVQMLPSKNFIKGIIEDSLQKHDCEKPISKLENSCLPRFRIVQLLSQRGNIKLFHFCLR